MRGAAASLVWAVLGLMVATAASAQDRPRVVTVNYPLQYFAERLLGPDVEVVFPVPEGVDPSFWRPSIADISRIQSADLILLNGAGFASWIDRVSLPRSKTVNTSAAFSDQYIVTDSITHSHGEGGEHSHEGTATYVWLDPDQAIQQAEAIASAAIARGLVSDGDVQPRLATLRDDLIALNGVARDAFSSSEQTVFVATHPRYQYLARAYDLNIVSLEWETGVAPSQSDLADLQELIYDRGATVLIWEAIPPVGAFAATEELGMKNLVIPPLAQPVQNLGLLDALAAAFEEVSVVLGQ